MQITGKELHTLIQNAVEGAILAMPAPREASPSEKLTIAQFSAEYKISKTTIHRLCRAGKLASEKIGRKTFFQRADVDGLFSSFKRRLDKPIGIG